MSSIFELGPMRLTPICPRLLGQGDADVPVALAPWSFPATYAAGTSASTQSGGWRTPERKRSHAKRREAAKNYSFRAFVASRENLNRLAKKAPD